MLKELISKPGIYLIRIRNSFPFDLLFLKKQLALNLLQKIYAEFQGGKPGSFIAAFKGRRCFGGWEIEVYPYGKFAHIIDPEGNKIELWEANHGSLKK